MHRIDGAGNLAGMFTNGDPGIGQEATVVTADWANAVQEEIVGVVLASGATLSKPDNTQLLTALNARYGRLATAGTWSAKQTFGAGAEVSTGQTLTLTGATVTGGTFGSASLTSPTITYSPALTLDALSEAADWTPIYDGSGTAPEPKVQFSTDTVVTNDALAGTDRAYVGRVVLPSGSSITGVTATLANTSGSTLTFSVLAETKTSTLTGQTSASPFAGSAVAITAGGTISVPTQASPRWRAITVPLAGAGPYSVPASGCVRFVVTIQKNDPIGNLLLEGLVFSYTLAAPGQPS